MTLNAKFEDQAYGVNSRDVIRRHDLEGLRWHAPVAPGMAMLLLAIGRTLRASAAKGRAAEQSFGR